MDDVDWEAVVAAAFRAAANCASLLIGLAVGAAVDGALVSTGGGRLASSLRVEFADPDFLDSASR